MSRIIAIIATIWTLWGQGMLDFKQEITVRGGFRSSGRRPSRSGLDQFKSSINHWKTRNVGERERWWSIRGAIIVPTSCTVCGALPLVKAVKAIA